MKKKLSNDERVKALKQRKILWYIIIIFAIATILLAICSLVVKISPIYAIICFVIETVATYFRNKIILDN